MIIIIKAARTARGTRNRAEKGQNEGRKLVEQSVASSFAEKKNEKRPNRRDGREQ